MVPNLASKKKLEHIERDARHMHTERDDHVRTQQEGSHLQARREASEGTKPDHTMILDFQPPEL